MTNTLQELTGRFGVGVDEHHDLGGLVPVVSGLTRQGDIIAIPTNTAKASTTPLPVGGYPVVRAETAARNTHLLLGDGPVFFTPASDVSATQLDLGVLTVPEGSVAYLAHPEHAFTGLAAGSWTIRRQREQADELRMVAD